MNRRLPIFAALSVALMLVAPAGAQMKRPPLSPADIDDIATLLKLEDTRQFDVAALARIVTSSHPEVRRRAVMSMGRIVSTDARPLLAALHDDADPEIVATAAWATGQQKDVSAVEWLGAVLNAKTTPPAVAKEAAQALGKIRTGEAAVALARYLAAAPTTAAAAPVVGEALLSSGRFASPTDPALASGRVVTFGDIAPIVRWSTAANPEVRWRAAWALFRPRNPEAVPTLLKMSADASPEVRFWAVRGLTAPVVAPSKVPLATAATRLRQATTDPDRRVRTEALRALVPQAPIAGQPAASYDDDASVAVVLNALKSTDTWLSVSAAEALGRWPDRAAEIAPRLIAASAADKPLALRIAALAPMVTLAPDAARTLAGALGAVDNATAKSAAATAIRQLDAAAARAAGTAPAAGRGAGGGARGGGRGGNAPPALVARPDAEYRALVTTWIVPAYNGARAPHLVFETVRGAVDIELNPGDAPFGVEYLVDVVRTGDIVGTEFGRVVPNFVDQENAIRPTGRLRDEVNRRGLTSGNLSWASAGLDTGRPGYTVGSTPQPHNEGDFTALGHVVKGLDVVDRIELGDKITGARIVK